MACVPSCTSAAHPARFSSDGLTSIASRLLRALRVGILWFAQQRLRYAAREINEGLLERIAASDPEAAREIRRPFDL